MRWPWDPSLRAEFEEALCLSRRLIVICSPFAVQSNYVADEIRYFIRNGRAADILCLIASGLPDGAQRGQPQLDCFPLPLQEAGIQPLAPAIGQESKAEWRHAISQVAAGLVGLSLNDYRQTLFRRQWRIAAWAAAGTMLVGVAAGVVAWGLWLPHVSHSADVVRRNGIWEPIGALSEADAAARDSYRFVRRGAWGMPIEVRRVDSQGQCTEAIDSISGDSFEFSCSNSIPCGVRFEYSEEQLVRERIIDQYGTTVETVSYVRPDVALISDAIIGCSRRPSGIEFLEIERDAQGFDRRFRFKGGADKSPKPNNDYAYGVFFEYTVAGQRARQTFLDASGTPTNGKSGYATTEWVYGINHEVKEKRTFDAKGNPIDSISGYAHVAYRYAENGSELERRYFGADGQPAIDAEGLHGTRTTKLGPGLSQVEFINIDGKPTVRADGAATVETQKDGHGRIVERAFLGVDGKPVPAEKRGCYIERTKIEDTSDGGSRNDQECFDAKGHPMLGLDGVFRVRSLISPIGQLIEESYFNFDGQPAYCLDRGDDSGCPVFRMINRFDSVGKRIATRFYGPDGTLAVNSDGVAGWDQIFDARNFVRRQISIGLDGKPSPSNKYLTIAESTHDEFGRVIRQVALDAEGNPTVTTDGRIATQFQYDDYGNMVEMRLLDSEGRLRAAKDGVAVVRKSYNRRGKVVEWRTFDANSRPVPNDEGWYGVHFAYDRHGREMLRQRMDGNGHLRPGSDGVAGIRAVYDDRGNAVAVDFLGVNGQPVLAGDGVAGYRTLYDKRKLLVERRGVGIGGQTAVNSQGTAFWRWKHDIRGRVVEETYHGLDGSLRAPPGSNDIAVKRMQYDERGRMIQITYFDVAGRPQANSSGEYGQSFRYDVRDQEVENAFLGSDGRPVSPIDMPAVTLSTRDAMGRVVRQQFLNADRQPQSDFPAAQIFEYDSYGRVIRRAFEDSSGKLTIHQISGRAEVRFRYDALGRLVEERSLGLNGQLINRRDNGWAVLRRSYDDAGKEQFFGCLDAKEQPLKLCRDD